MDSGQWIKIKETFSAVAELPLEERSAFLKRSDPLIRDEVEKLLAASDSAGDFIVSPIHVENGHAGLDEKSIIGREIDDYAIIEKIGEGGMGAVYLAEHRGQEFSQRVALKLIKRGMDTDAVLKRFFIERQILASLDHPNIARLLDGGSTEDGLPYFVMELVEGENIREFCDGHRYDTNERLQLFQKVCHAISHAHQNLIVHRDIKPTNIVVTKSGEPKLLDFGIAKLLSPDWYATTAEVTATNFRLMTPEYASPEQLRGQMTTTATDVYSLGVVLYELLTGARPYKFTSKDPFEISREILTIEPLRPSAVVSGQWSVISDEKSTPDNIRPTAKGQRPKTEGQSAGFRNPHSAIRNLKGDLDNIILKAIRKDPKDRYKSVEELAEDVDRYLNGLPVRATADSPTYRFKKFIARNRVGTAVAALILLLSGVASWQAVVATRERARADERVRQLREVAKSLLSETSQNLQHLPDGSEVRQQVIEKSASLLDSLSADTDDVEYMSELGTAYQQLGNSRTWHLRAFEQASNDLQKARQLHERVVELEPNNSKYLANLVGTLGVQSEFYGIQGNTDKVIENSETIIKIDLKRIQIEPNNPHIVIDTSKQFDVLSENYIGVGRKEESVEASQRALELLERAIELQQANEQTPDVQTQLAGYFMQKGYMLKKSGKEDEAILAYSQSAETADQAYFRDNTQKYGFNHSNRSRRMMAEIYVRRGDWQKVLELHQHCLNSLLKNKENKNLAQKGLPGSIALYTMFVGNAQDKLGQKQAGRENVEKGLNLYLAQIEKYENLAGDLFYAYEGLNAASDYYIANNQRKKAADLWQREFIDRLETILQEAPNDSGMLFRTAESYANKGDILSGYQAEGSSFSETNMALLKAAFGNYQKAIEYVGKVVALGESAVATTKKSEDLQQRIELLRSKLSG